MHHNFSRHVDPLDWNDIIFQHDNARVHTSQRVRSFLEEKGVMLLRQPAWSPDYNFCDRWWFSKLEAARKTISFDDESSLQEFLTDALRNVSQDELRQQFQYLKNDLSSVIDCNGDYL